jgi:hypothetical protein
MNIDQRIEALTERHEALTQTVELIAAAQVKADERIREVTGLLRETGQFINQLAHIAAAHEQRLDRLEG